MSIQQAVNLAGTGETVLVSAGTYTYDSSLNINCLNYIAVVCVKNKELTILGGFAGGDWENADPVTNETVIDGEDLYQGVHVRDVSATASASLELDGFTITRGHKQGASSGASEDTAAFGGGLAAYSANVVLRDLVFSDNYAIGGDTSDEEGGGGIGGGAVIHSAPGVSVLERVTFTGNHAHGGSGVEKGGWGIGGGLYTYQSEVSLTDVTFTDNVNIAGSTNGSGINGAGQKADAQGGGVAFHIGTTATVDGLVATGNSATGGAAPNGLAGGGYGGGVYCEKALDVTIRNADIRDNLAQGGHGDSGGLGAGGGLFDGTTPVTLDRIQLIANQAIGGDGVTKQGSAGGGAIYFNRTPAFPPVSAAAVTNAIVADNLAQLGAGSGAAGGGGGFYFSRVDGIITHSTFARNQLGATPMQGLAMSLLNQDGDTVVVDISYSIISDHTSTTPSTPALKVQELCTANLDTGLFAGNDLDTNDGLSGAGTINGLYTMINATSAGFLSPGAPDYDYHLTSSSEAKDEATGSTTTVDFENQNRWDGYPDIGADEEGPILIFSDDFESGDLSAWSKSAP